MVYFSVILAPVVWGLEFSQDLPLHVSSCMQWRLRVWTVAHWVVLVQVIYSSEAGWVLYFFYTKLLDHVVSGARFLTGVAFECDIAQHWFMAALYICCIISGVTRCTLSKVIYLCRIWQCGLHTVLWYTVGILMRLLAAQPRGDAGPLFSSQRTCRTILLPLYSMVWHWRVSRVERMFFYFPKLLEHFLSSAVVLLRVSHYMW